MCDLVSYRICDSVLGSNIPLPELPYAGEKQRECCFKLVLAPVPSLASADWFHQWPSADGQVWLAFARVGSDYVLRFRDIADFTVSADGREIQCIPQPGTPLDTIKHLLLDQVVPLTLSRRGSLILHASAIVTPAGAIAFLGATGQGKSTLAASFSEQGFPFLTDDCLVLKQRGDCVLAIPSYPGLRLWSETLQALFQGLPALPQVAHYSEKKRLVAGDRFPFHAEPVAIKRIYLLSEAASGISIDPVPPRNALPELMEYTYVMDIDNREDLKDKFERLSGLATLPLCYRLAFRRDFSLLPDVRRAILAHLNT
jgi:hypothetical protein